MTDDMLQWAQVSPIGVGEGDGGDLVSMAQAPPPPIDVRLKRPRHRPNNGRRRRFIGEFLEEPPWEMLRALPYPIPSDIVPLTHIPAQWRGGHKARVWRAQVFDMWGRICHLCNHPGADSADHLIPLAAWGNQPWDARLSRPAHGVAGCPTCEVKCNSSRGHRLLAKHMGQYQPPIEL